MRRIAIGTLSHMIGAGGRDTERPILVDLVDDSPSGRSRFGGAFRSWTNGADVRVLFTPDVFIAVSNDVVRGYLFDDGWSVECWIERGVPEFRESLGNAFEGVERGYTIVAASDRANLEGLLEWAIRDGAAIDAVRHLM